VTGPLHARLIRRIAAEGPLTVADFMAAALLDPRDGYYTRATPLGDESGRGGDFVTAPELTQVFGELLGLWCLEAWQRLGAPPHFKLVELGPGRGSLMSDVLRSLALIPGCRAAAEIHLVEVSPRLRAMQRDRLRGAKVTWHRGIATLPAGFAVILANEFLDALPIRQFEKTPQGWRERLVVRDGAGGLTFALSGTLPSGLLDAPDAATGAILEHCSAATAVAEALAERFRGSPGAALFIDYGYATRPWKGSLQAVAGHRKVPALSDPGCADLSALVDFFALGQAAERAGARVHGPVTQAALLQALGIEERSAGLQHGKSPEVARAIAAACRRLIAPGGMGESFLAISLEAPGLESPAGFPLA